MNKQPLKTAKTRQAIVDAFWELSAMQGMDKVTISAVCKRAGLNRGTFYVYFTDMPELIAGEEEAILADLRARMEIGIREGGFHNFELVSEQRIQDAFRLYDDKLFMLMGKNGDPNFRVLVIDEASKAIQDVFRPFANSEYIVAYLTSAFMGVLTYWHETGKQIGKMELARMIHTLVTQGLGGITDVKSVSCGDGGYGKGESFSS